MIYLQHRLHQSLPASALATEVRAVLGKPLRRAAPLAQLAVAGALACLPDTTRAAPLALIWQSTAGPRAETQTLLEEVCHGACEPLPYDFLASQPAIAAAQLKPFLPGLQLANHLPLARETETQWALMLTLAHRGLAEGRFACVLCAHLDVTNDMASGEWLVLSASADQPTLARLAPAGDTPADTVADTAEFPARLDTLLTDPAGSGRRLRLHSPALPKLTVEFAR